MEREESIALFLQGRSAWNAWAEKMLGERKGLEAEGGWDAAKDWRGGLEPRNEKTRAWIEAAKADFTDAGFEAASWPKMRLPARPVELEGNRVDFEGFVFPGDAVFDRVTFTGDAYFKRAVFSGTASFDKAVFSGAALFQHAIFGGPASFEGASFAWHAHFEGAAFPAGASFARAYFRRTAGFERVTADGAFSLAGARFDYAPPSLLSARFAAPPVFDKMQLAAGAEPGLFVQSVIGGFFLWIIGQLDPSLNTRYRALRRLGEQADDHRSQQLFACGELRSRRYTEDKPWHAAFWLGIVYELASGFGRSFARPVFWLIALTLVSAWFYLAQHTPPGVAPLAQLQSRVLPFLPAAIGAQPAAPPKLACRHGDGDPVAEAIQLAVRQSLVIGGLDSAKDAPLYGCLYGYNDALRAPVAPDAVVLWGIVQTLAAAALWLLLLLALRNRFRVR